MISAVPAPRAWPEPVADRPVLTDKGQAVRTVYRLACQLAELDAAARADLLHLLRAEIPELA